MRKIMYEEGGFFEVLRTGFNEVSYCKIDVVVITGFKWVSDTNGGEITRLVIIESDKDPRIEACVLITDSDKFEKELGFVEIRERESLS